MAGQISMGARREIKSAVVERYRVAGRAEKGLALLGAGLCLVFAACDGTPRDPHLGRDSSARLPTTLSSRTP